MVKDASAHSDEDRKRREEIEAKNRLDSLIYSTEKTFNENKSRLDAGDIASYESALADARKALEAGGTDNMNRAGEQLQQTAHKLAEAMYRNASQASQTAGSDRAAASGGSAAKEDGGHDTGTWTTEE
jgi:molecular chaperone DnaK